MEKHSVIVFMVCLASFSQAVVNASLVVRGANFTTMTAEARRMSFDGRYVQYSTTVGQLVNQSFPNPSGKIVFFTWSPPQHDWIGPFVHNLSRQGVIGVVIAHTVRDDDLGGIQFLFGPYPGWREVNMPIIAIKAQDWGPIQDNWENTTLIAEFNCTDADAGLPEIENRSWYTYVILVIGAAFSCGVAIVAGIVFTHLVRLFGLQLNINIVVTLFEALSSAWRFLAWSLDGVHFYRLAYTRFARTMYYLHMPFALGSGILLVFFWHETTMKSAVTINMWLSRLRIPAFIFCGILFVLTFIVEMGKFTPWAIQYVRVQVIVFAVVVGMLGIFYVITSIRIFRALSSSTSGTTSEAHKTRVRRMTRRLIVGGVFYLALVVTEIIDAMDWAQIVTFHRGVLLYNPPGFTHARLNYFFRDIFMNGAALMTVLSFAEALLRKRRTKPSGTGTTGTISLGSSGTKTKHGSSDASVTAESHSVSDV